MPSSDLLNISIHAALEAGEEIMKIYDTDDFQIEIKADLSPLTIADKRANDIICQFLSKTSIPILSEEGKNKPYAIRKNWNALWIVDPIDGTKEFINRNGEFTVNIAYVVNQIPVLGVIYVPAKKIIYYSDGSNAYKVLDIDKYNFNKKLSQKIQLPVCENNQSVYTIVASKSHLTIETAAFIEQKKQELKDVEIISKGSSLKFCLVAEGLADCYPRFAPTMEWDTAAGQAICSAVGKKVIDIKTNQPLLYNRENLLNYWFLVD